MQARNRKNGAAIVRVVEHVPATRLLAPEAFRRTAEGLQYADLETGVDIDWDGVKPAARNGRRLFFDEFGELVTEDEIELFTTTPAQ